MVFRCLARRIAPARPIRLPIPLADPAPRFGPPPGCGGERSGRARREIAALRARISAPGAASLRISTSLDLETVLNEVEESAREGSPAFIDALGRAVSRYVRIPVKLITGSGVKLDSDSGQAGHRSERSDAGLEFPPVTIAHIALRNFKRFAALDLPCAPPTLPAGPHV